MAETERPARSRTSSPEDWEHQRVSVPLYVILVLVSGALGTAGGTGVVSKLLGPHPETERQIKALEDELRDLDRKLDAIADALDEADRRPRYHPQPPPAPATGP